LVRAQNLTKRHLEIQLGKLRLQEDPKVGLEQYPVSPEVASELLYMAGFEHHDLERRVIDLGTGTGRLAIGAKLMGAGEVVGVEIDERAIRLAQLNAERARVRVEWVVADLVSIRGWFDAVVMNPPYGTRQPKKDTWFLTRALELAPVTYSIHKSSTRDYLLRFVRKQGWTVDEVRSASLVIPHLFEFHKKKWKTVQVDLYRIVA